MTEIKIVPKAECSKCGLTGTDDNPVRIHKCHSRVHSLWLLALCDDCARREAETEAM